jgi:hypothetical protein
MTFERLRDLLSGLSKVDMRSSELFFELAISGTLSDTNCTDPRDKIYSMLGLLDLGIFPDYGKRTEDVYIEFGRLWATKTGGANILQFAGSAYKFQIQTEQVFIT